MCVRECVCAQSKLIVVRSPVCIRNSWSLCDICHKEFSMKMKNACTQNMCTDIIAVAARHGSPAT